MLEGYHWEEREKREPSVLRRDMVGWWWDCRVRAGAVEGVGSEVDSQHGAGGFLSFFLFSSLVLFGFRFPGAATKCLPTRPGRCPLSRLLDQARLAAASARRMLCVDCPFSLRPRTRVEVKRVRQVLGCYQDRESRAVCDSSKSSLDLRQFLWQKEVLNETLSTP